MPEQEADADVAQEEEVVHEPPRKRRPPIEPPEETVVPVVAKDLEMDIVDSAEETCDGWGQGLETPAPSPPEPAAQPLVAPSAVPAPTDPTPAVEPKDSVPAAPPTVPGQPDVERQDSQGTLLCTS